MSSRGVGWLLAFSLLAVGPAKAESQATAQSAVAEARLLLDGHYYDTDDLAKAAALLAKSREMGRESAEGYVQAARLVIKSGSSERSGFAPGVLDRYDLLIDKALSLDAQNQKAHLLKAEAFNIRRAYAQEKLALDSASRLGLSDPWLYIGYGRHYASVGDSEASATAYRRVREMMKDNVEGSALTQRRAYVSALLKLARLPENRSPTRLKELAEEARSGRPSKDAWILGEFARLFVWQSMFDEAIDFSDAAIRVVSYRDVRETLALSLYAKAASLQDAGDAKQSAKSLERARAVGIDATSMRAVLNEWQPHSRELWRLRSLIEQGIE